MVKEGTAATHLTDDQLAASTTTGQPWLNRSTRLGFTFDNPEDTPVSDQPMVAALPTNEELQEAAVSRCGKKFIVIGERRKDHASGKEVDCATLGVLLITKSPEHWHLDTGELYLVLDVNEDSSMVVGNQRVKLRPGMLILLPPGEKNKHGGFGSMRALMLFTPGLAKRGNDGERDEKETGQWSRTSAAELPELTLDEHGEATTDGGIVIGQIPPQYMGEPSAIRHESEGALYKKKIPGLAIAALTVRGDAPTYVHEHPGTTKIYTILGGEGQVLVGDKFVKVQTDSVVLVPPNVPNALVSIPGGAVNAVISFLHEDRAIKPEDLERMVGREARPRMRELLKA